MFHQIQVIISKLVRCSSLPALLGPLLDNLAGPLLLSKNDSDADGDNKDIDANDKEMKSLLI